MKTYNKLYEQIYSIDNLILAWKKARKGKTKKSYVIEFEKNLRHNLKELCYELKYHTYSPKPLKTFILRDPKTRKISVSDFRDRIVHHAIINVLGPIFEKIFIYDSCANRKGKGNLFALKRLKFFIRKISENGNCLDNKFHDSNFIFGYCLKADIKHYFQKVNQKILVEIMKRKIIDKEAIFLVKLILENYSSEKEGVGMPLGNLTSQFFANIYLNELDYFVKHELKAKYYIRYVDDFVILYKSKIQLDKWKEQINKFLTERLEIELHNEKSRIIPLSRGIDFVGFRVFYYFKLLRKRNIKNIIFKIEKYNKEYTSREKFLEMYQGWNAYAKWANSHKLKKNISDCLFLNLCTNTKK